jgi:hypothetical protein
VFVVQAHEEGRLVCETGMRNIRPGATPVMIWQQGAHFEALVKTA